jgi:hypothetical protein
MRASLPHIFLASLLLLGRLVHAAPQVITGASLPGPKATLGTPATLLIVGDRGVSARVTAPAGRVRVTAWLRYNGKGEAYRLVPYGIKAGDASASHTVDALASGVPCSVTVLHRGGELPISITRGALPPEAKSELTRLQTAQQQAVLDPDQAGEDGPGLGEDAPDDAHPVDARALPLPTVLLERLEVATVSGPLIITAMGSDRITYAPGATGSATVSVRNLSAVPQSGTLTVEMTEGLATRTPLWSGPLTVDGGGTLERTLPLAVGLALWGRGIEARMTTPVGEDRGAHAVSVVTNPWMVAFHGQGLPQFGSQHWTPEEAERQAESIAAANRATYCNVYEAFAWAPCDFSEMTPETDEPFYSGQTQYAKRRSALQTLHRVFHQYGIACVTYGKSCASGLPGMEYALAHPERMNVFSPAGFAHEAISVDVIDRMLEGRYRSHGRDEDFWQYWMSAWTALGNVEAAEDGVDEIARSAKLLGWDAVRYDGHFSAWRDPAMSARLVRHAADRLTRQVPGFGLGYNYMGPQHSTPQGAFGDAELAACARGGGLIMSEYYRGILGPVRDNIEHLRWGGDATRLHGGHWLAILDDKSDWNAALTLASGARPMGGSTRFNKFATRYSAFILDPAMRRLHRPEVVLTPVGAARFRWDAFVYEKELSADRTALILQLVNAADSLTFHAAGRPPTGTNPPQTDVAFQLTLPPGYTAESVVACDDASSFQTQAATLTGNRLTIPQVSLWTLAVVTLKRTAPPRTLAELCEAPVVFTGTAAMSNEELRAQLKIGAGIGPDLAARVQAGKVAITPAVLDAILAPGAPVSAGPGEKAYQPASFIAHRDGLDRAGAPAGTPLNLQRDGRPDIHCVRGVFSHRDRLDEALARVKGARVTFSSLDNGRVACGEKLSEKNVCCLTGFPTPRQLAQTDVVLLDDIPAPAFTREQRRQLLAFVENGGSLLVLGGWYALSKGNYEGSFLEEALPISVVQQSYLLRLRGTEQRIRPTAEFTRLLGGAVPDFGTAGAVEWMNHLQLKPGAQVLLTAGERPLLIAGHCGKGRVAVWAGAHAGAPSTPYWQSAVWPAVLGRVVTYLATGADAASPPDPALAGRLAGAQRALEGKVEPGAALTALREVLAANTPSAACYVATYLLENPGKVSPDAYDELIEGVLPHISATPEWQGLGEEFQDDPPPMLNRLVAEIAAGAQAGLGFETIKEWDIPDVTRVRCLAAAADKSALPYLQGLERTLAAKEQRWAALIAAHEQSTDTVADLYMTRLLRPFVAYARLRCGERTEETLSALCRGALDLPYYAWRQRWILESAEGAVSEAQQAANPEALRQAHARVARARRAVRELDAATRQAARLFTPTVVGMDAPGRHAAARALAQADSRKALPLALAFIDACTGEELAAMPELDRATLESVGSFYRGRVGR